MAMSTRAAAMAAQLKELHTRDRPIVLPTVWDAWSARTAERGGFAALTIGSHPLAEALGSEDGEKLSLEEVFAAVAPIIASASSWWPRPIICILIRSYSRWRRANLCWSRSRWRPMPKRRRRLSRL